MSSMFASLFGSKSKGKETDPFVSSFSSYGRIGDCGGFHSHALAFERDKGTAQSDHKYRVNQTNSTGPLFANRALRGHLYPVIAASWSPSANSLLASIGKDSTLITWDVTVPSKQATMVIGGGHDLIMCCAMSPGNNLIVCGGMGGQVYITERNVKSGALKASGAVLTDHEGYVCSCFFLDDAHVVTGSGDATCKIFDINKPNTSLSSFEHDADVAAVVHCHPYDSDSSGTASSRGGQMLLSASGNSMYLWDARQPTSSTSTSSGRQPAMRIQLQGAAAADITALDVCRDKGYLVCCGDEAGSCYVNDLRRCGSGNSSYITSTPATTPVTTTAAPLVYCGDRDLTQQVASVAFSHSGSTVFAGYRSWVKNYMDCVVVAFDVSAGCDGGGAAVAGAATSASADGSAGGSKSGGLADGIISSNININSNSIDDSCAASVPIQDEGSNTLSHYAPHCVIGSNPAITSSEPFSYSYQNCSSTFMSSMRINCDGCALAAASHDGTITIFRQQR